MGSNPIGGAKENAPERGFFLWHDTEKRDSNRAGVNDAPVGQSTFHSSLFVLHSSLRSFLRHFPVKRKKRTEKSEEKRKLCSAKHQIIDSEQIGSE